MSLHLVWGGPSYRQRAVNRPSNAWCRRRACRRTAAHHAAATRPDPTRRGPGMADPVPGDDPFLRDGVTASRLQLPPGPWSTVFEALCARFPRVGAEVWRDRFLRG